MKCTVSPLDTLNSKQFSNRILNYGSACLLSLMITEDVCAVMAKKRLGVTLGTIKEFFYFMEDTCFILELFNFLCFKSFLQFQKLEHYDEY